MGKKDPMIRIKETTEKLLVMLEASEESKKKIMSVVDFAVSGKMTDELEELRKKDPKVDDALKAIAEAHERAVKKVSKDVE